MLWIQDMPVGCIVNVDKVIVDRREVWAHSENSILVWGWADGKTSKVINCHMHFIHHRFAFFTEFIHHTLSSVIAHIMPGPFYSS